MEAVHDIPREVSDPVNARILAVSEDRIAGFHEEPFREIARLSGVDEEIVHARLRAMLQAGTIRGIRQTLLTTSLAPGALVAWRIAPEKLDAAFEFLFREDPFSGHVVIRSTDASTPGSAYRLWTTLKVPQGHSIEDHCRLLMRLTGADDFRAMPARKLFALGVGHVRRRGLEPGSRSEELGEVIDTNIVELSPEEWRVLEVLKRELAPDEVGADPWRRRAVEAAIPFEDFVRLARELSRREVIGRFSTFLEHVKPSAGGSA
jgi:DNA-binding Lrp family transcriptional regulator